MFHTVDPSTGRIIIEGDLDRHLHVSARLLHKICMLLHMYVVVSIPSLDLMILDKILFNLLLLFVLA